MWDSTRLIQALFGAWPICIGAGLAALTNQGLANQGPPFGSQNAVLMRFAWAANESQFYSSRFGQSRLNRFYQPKARYKNRPDSKLGSVRLEIAARLKARFSARDSMTRLDLARAGHCRSEFGSPRLGLTRLGSARLATRGSTHFRSWLRLSLGLRIWTGESTRCSTRLSSEFGSGSGRS